MRKRRSKIRLLRVAYFLCNQWEKEISEKSDFFMLPPKSLVEFFWFNLQSKQFLHSMFIHDFDVKKSKDWNNIHVIFLGSKITVKKMHFAVYFVDLCREKFSCLYEFDRIEISSHFFNILVEYILFLLLSSPN